VVRWPGDRTDRHRIRPPPRGGGRVTAAPARPRLVPLSSVELADHLGEALDVYVAAMGYPPGTARQRRNLWLEHSRRPGWRCTGWLDPGGHLIGIAYGYSGGHGQWWFEEVRRGLAARGMSREIGQPDWLRDYFELTELHVRPDAQGSRLGEGMLRALLDGVRHDMVLLSTPEHAPPGLAALPPSRLRGRAAGPPLHRRQPPLRGPGAPPPAPSSPTAPHLTDRISARRAKGWAAARRVRDPPTQPAR